MPFMILLGAVRGSDSKTCLGMVVAALDAKSGQQCDSGELPGLSLRFS